MKFLILFALAFATVWGKDLYSRSIEIPVLENEGRITNGKNATPGQFRYQVGIRINRGNIFLWCGGSFIARTWILTAAKCIDRTLWAKVYLGATERLVAETSYTVLRSDMTMHSNFNRDTLRNDIGLMRIPITSVTGTIGFARIPRDDYDSYVYKLAVITGWGQTDGSPALSNYLKYATLRVSTDYECSRLFPRFYYSDIHMCIATPDLMSPCQGDDGGPLVLEGETLQIGVFSFNARRSCEPGNPSVFTRVSAYISWIRSHID